MHGVSSLYQGNKLPFPDIGSASPSIASKSPPNGISAQRRSGRISARGPYGSGPVSARGLRAFRPPPPSDTPDTRRRRQSA